MQNIINRWRVFVTVKDLLRPLPGVRRMSMFRQQLSFQGSARYWERNYARGGTSGDGSYGAVGQAKADFLNSFVRERVVQSVVEFGCGDGNQLSLADYPRYAGLDVSQTALELCKRRFAEDLSKSFFLYDGNFFVDNACLFAADLALSLDVVYHLIEEPVFETYMSHLFGAGHRYVIIYATNTTMGGTAPHVRHRSFSSWVDDNSPEWRLARVARGPGVGPARADFFIYERHTPKPC
jgi:SAM-dependent methyltransferase